MRKKEWSFCSKTTFLSFCVFSENIEFCGYSKMSERFAKSAKMFDEGIIDIFDIYQIKSYLSVDVFLNFLISIFFFNIGRSLFGHLLHLKSVSYALTGLISTVGIQVSYKDVKAHPIISYLRPRAFCIFTTLFFQRQYWHFLSVENVHLTTTFFSTMMI